MIECHVTNTEVTINANQSKWNYHNEPMKVQSKENTPPIHTHTPAAYFEGKQEWPCHNEFSFDQFQHFLRPAVCITKAK